MVHRKPVVRILTLIGSALGALVLTVVMLALVQAQEPSVIILKEPDQMVLNGSTVTFTIAISNTGAVTLTELAVLDALAPNCARAQGDVPDLAPGEGTRYECARTNVTADFTNSALVVGTDVVSATTVTASDTAFVGVVAPAVRIAKTPDLQTVVRGSSAAFTIVVTNTGDVTLTNVTVLDTQVPDCERVFIELLPGESRGYSCVIATVTDDFVNTATVTATPPVGGEVMHSDTAAVEVLQPAIQIAKVPDLQVVPRGSSVSFNIAVTNTGEVSLTSVSIVDLLASDCDNGFAMLGIRESEDYTCTFPAVADDFTNVVTVTALSPIGEMVADADTASVFVLPEIEVAKTPDEQTVSSGSSVTFTIAVTNASHVALANVVVSDTRAPDCDASWGTLAAGRNIHYQCTLDNVTQGLINNVVVTATSSQFGIDVTDVDAARVRLAETLACPSGMTAYWKLDETHGPPYRDYYYGREGECVGSCPTATTGHLDGAQAFDGGETGIEIPVVPGDDSFNWGANDSFSIEFWMKADSAHGCSLGNEVVVGRDDASSWLHWWVGIGCSTGGQAEFYLVDTGGHHVKVLGTTLLTDGLWHHVAAVRDASAKRIRIYVDGVEENSQAATYAVGFESLTAALNVGWLNLSSGYHFAGIVDEMAVYDRVLSSGEVRQHYNEGLAGRWYCQPGAYAPVVVSPPITEATSGRLYIYDVEAVGSPVPTYTLVTNPQGMSIAPATGLISWVPTVAQEGQSHNVQVRASNSEGAVTQSFTVVVHEGTICPHGLIAYWKLDEEGDVAAYDDFYDGHAGVCAGQCPTPTVGHINGGQAFDSSHTGIDVPADEAFDWSQTDSFSIEFWMKADGAHSCALGNEVVVGRDDASSQLHWWVGIGCSTGGQAEFYLADTGGHQVNVLGTTLLTDGLWHHVAAVRDAVANRIRIYIDSQEENSQPAIYSAGFGSLSAPLNIGWLNLAPGYHFAGTLDEVALYGRALSATEVAQHYNSGEPGPGYCINPAITIRKTANLEVVYSGDPITYTYMVTNTGDIPLMDVYVDDDKCRPVTLVGNGGELGPDEYRTFHCLMDLYQDTANTATVTGTFSMGDMVDMISATHTISVDVINPGMIIHKTANSATIDAGGTVTYTYVVTNSGDDPLSDVNVNDDKCTAVSFVGGDDDGNSAFDPDEAWIYTCSMVLTATTTNTGTATGTDSAGGRVSAIDTAFVNVATTKYIYLPVILRQTHLIE